MSRLDKNYVVGNWKMNQTKKDVDSFLEEVEQHNCHQWIAPQAIHLPYLTEQAKSKSKDYLLVGSQNHATVDFGAFTGENSLHSLKEYGSNFCLVGHSERRQIFNETHEQLSPKIKQAIKHQQTVIFCIGETLQQRESGATNTILTEQLTLGLTELNQDALKYLLIAYEPVWAIGTGKVATTDQAQQAHQHVRETLVELFGDLATTIPLLYGGSVKPDNIESLLQQSEINGALVGGASLSAKDYNKLCDAAS